jgi:hypothetical protein
MCTCVLLLLLQMLGITDRSFCHHVAMRLVVTHELAVVRAMCLLLVR